jgi:hypothetical protein
MTCSVPPASFPRIQGLSFRRQGDAPLRRYHASMGESELASALTLLAILGEDHL